MPPGRPREFDADRVVDDAMGLLWRRGYRATTTRQLEAALGVRQGSLYRAFGSKAALMDAAIRRYETLLARELLDPLLRGPEGLASLDRFLGGLGEWLEADGDRGCLLGRLLAEGPPGAPELDAALARFHAGLRAALEAALGRAAAAGQIDRATVPTRTAMLEAAILGLNLALAGGYARAARRDLLDGIRAEVGRWHAGGPPA
jgi:TetR/AcrR family transcriptional regulator, transcriptional repressor for nem operon